MDTIFIFGAKYLFIFSLLGLALYISTSPVETRKKLAVFLLVSLPFTYLAGLGARQVYFNPRPFMVSEVEPLIEHEADNGFPSDHVLLVGTLSAAMIFFDRKYAWWLWGITIFVAISRVYAGVHHFLDVGASVIIALLCAILVKTYLWNKTNF